MSKVTCDSSCKKCDGPSQYMCTECDTKNNKVLNRATGECQCKYGFKMNKDDDTCERYSFSHYNYDQGTMSRYFCSVNCAKKVKFAENPDFVLKITTKDG